MPPLSIVKPLNVVRGIRRQLLEGRALPLVQPLSRLNRSTQQGIESVGRGVEREGLPVKTVERVALEVDAGEAGVWASMHNVDEHAVGLPRHRVHDVYRSRPPDCDACWTAGTMRTSPETPSPAR